MTSWQMMPTDNMGTVLHLYQSVFGEQLSRGELEDRTSGFKVHLFLIAREGEPPSGFAIFRGKGSEVELWMAGITPERRNLGAGSCLLDRGRRHMIELGYSRLTVSTFNHWNIMLSMLIRRGYRIVGTTYSERREDFKIILHLELRKRREIRYALAERCNFRCIFCHNEGLGHNERAALADNLVLDMVKSAVGLGYSDVTFTGGEPLLNKKRLVCLLDGLGEMDGPPELTLVTNGSLLDRDTVRRLADYPGKRKIHLSMHAADESTFEQVTGMAGRGLFYRVLDNIRMASDAGLTVKMNHVVLQNVNHEKVLDAVELARSLGVSTIKFIELLVLPSNPENYRLYYDVRAIKRRIEQVAVGPQRISPRQLLYRHKNDSRFSIEIQQCTCALGCAQCREARDLTFSSDMAFHPCFVRDKRFYRMDSPQQMKQVLKKGERIIDGYAAKYRDSSPTLVQKEQFVPGKRELFFLVDDVDRFRDHLRGKGFGQKAAVGFHEEYFRPVLRSEGWDRFEKVLKVGYDYHDRSKVDLIYTDHTYTDIPNLGMETTTRYLFSTGPVRFETMEAAHHFLERLDFELYLTLEWSLEIWCRGEIELSLSTGEGHSTVKIYGPAKAAAPVPAIFEQYEGRVVPLTEPLVSFMLRQKKAGQETLKKHGTQP